MMKCMALWVNPNVFLFGVFGVLSRPYMDKPWFLNVWRWGGGGGNPQAKESEPQLLFFLGSLFSFFNRCPFYSGYLYLLCSVSICGCFLETCPFHLNHFVVDINWLILLPYLVRHHLRREFLVRNRLLGGSVGWTNDTT